MQVAYRDETIWATQKAMAQLFDVGGRLERLRRRRRPRLPLLHQIKPDAACRLPLHNALRDRFRWRAARGRHPRSAACLRPGVPGGGETRRAHLRRQGEERGRMPRVPQHL